MNDLKCCPIPVRKSGKAFADLIKADGILVVNAVLVMNPLPRHTPRRNVLNNGFVVAELIGIRFGHRLSIAVGSTAAWVGDEQSCLRRRGTTVVVVPAQDFGTRSMPADTQKRYAGSWGGLDGCVADSLVGADAPGGFAAVVRNRDTTATHICCTVNARRKG